MIKYYLLDERVTYEEKDKEGNTVGTVTKEPLFMKKYAYTKLAFNKWATQVIVQTYEEVPEAKELTLEEANLLAQKWFTESDQKPQIIDNPDGTKNIIEPSQCNLKDYDRKEIREVAYKLNAQYGVK